MPENQRPTLFATLSQIAFWTVAIAFIAYVSYLGLDAETARVRVLFIIGCHAIVFYLSFYYLYPQFVERKEKTRAVANFLLMLSALTLIRYAGETFFFRQSIIERRQEIGTVGVVVLILFSEITIAAFAVLLRTAVNQEKQVKNVAAIKQLQLETELMFLKNQMSPHFLFNTLNNIYGLTLNDPDRAPISVLKLSSLLRYLLYECNHRVSLSQEVAALNDYRELFSLKFQHPPSIRITAPMATEAVTEMEPLLLLPLLENACKHSDIGMSPNSFIEMHISVADNQLHIICRNSIAEATPSSTPEASGIGLANIEKRLNLLFPDSYRLRCQQTANIFEVELQIPVVCHVAA